MTSLYIINKSSVQLRSQSMVSSFFLFFFCWDVGQQRPNNYSNAINFSNYLTTKFISNYAGESADPVSFQQKLKLTNCNQVPFLMNQYMQQFCVTYNKCDKKNTLKWVKSKLKLQKKEVLVLFVSI